MILQRECWTEDINRKTKIVYDLNSTLMMEYNVDQCDVLQGFTVQGIYKSFIEVF